jgi:hypothetical protein
MMVRILHVASVLALIAASVVFALCVRNHQGEDQQIGEFLACSAAEKLNQSQRDHAKERREQLSPLVRQAQILAAYLNPPVSPKRERAARPEEETRVVAQSPEITPAATSPKFKLQGISYRPSKPKASMALIWEPDGRRRWVKEGTQLGHVTIVEINSDSVLYADGGDTQTMAVDIGHQVTPTFAGGHKEDRSSPTPMDHDKPAVARWAPVRHIRQIPPSRAAAKMGVSERNQK